METIGIILLAIIAYFLWKIYSQKEEKRREIADKKHPSYEEILKMEESEAKKIFLERHTDNLKSLLAEMIDHEELTRSFAKTARGEIKPEEQMILNVFSREKSKKITALFDKIDNTLKDSESGAPNLIDDAVFAKFASDFFMK